MPVQPVTSAPAMPPASMISSPQELNQMDFLQMLTAQLKAQDPMNPLQGQEFASQLAQFSSLQQLQNMSQTMDKTLQADMLLAQTFNNTMASALIGKTVRADMDNFTLGSSGNTTLSYNLPSAATSITVDIKYSDGKVVRSIHVNPQEAGEHSVTWDGTDATGHRVSPGNYTYAINAKGADGSTVQATTFVEGRVSAVRYEDGNAVLTVNGMTVQLGQVISISDPSDPSFARKG
jgi:flagellar basal-body rod modification protein FlgD